VIGDHHDHPRAEPATDAARCVGQDQRLHPERGERAHRQRAGGRVVPFVQVKASALDQYRHLAEHPRHQLPRVSDDGGRGKVRNLGVGDSDRLAYPLGERAQPRAEGDRHPGAPAAEPRLDRAGGLAHRLLAPGGHASMPAMQAEMKAARLPAIIARSPKRAISPRRLGASPPIPPI
jgi:hypothetical protein